MPLFAVTAEYSITIRADSLEDAMRIHRERAKKVDAGLNNVDIKEISFDATEPQSKVASELPEIEGVVSHVFSLNDVHQKRLYDLLEKHL